MQRQEIRIHVELNDEGVYEAFDDSHSLLVYAETQSELLASIHQALLSRFGNPTPVPKFILH